MLKFSFKTLIIFEVFSDEVSEDVSDFLKLVVEPDDVVFVKYSTTSSNVISFSGLLISFRFFDFSPHVTYIPYFPFLRNNSSPSYSPSFFPLEAVAVVSSISFN